MKFGVFVVPYRLEHHSVNENFEWSLDVIRSADSYGFGEAWIGEHFTLPMEPCPAPDLLIASALRETEKIKLAPGAHILPYHHPVDLAHRIAYLDHMANGRYMLGIGAGAFPTDATLFDTNGQNTEMMVEALDLITRIWTSTESFEFRGDFWNCNFNLPDESGRGSWLRPLQQPHPPIGVAGTAPNSISLGVAGQKGWMPMSLNYGGTSLDSHWTVYGEGAAATGRTASREDWRVVQVIYVAETDEEARREFLGSSATTIFDDYTIPGLRRAGRLSLLTGFEPESPDEVTAEYLCDRVWAVGSPDTVYERIAESHQACGGWGTTIMFSFDDQDRPEPWRQSMEMFMAEVAPRLAKLPLTAQAAHTGRKS
ncbi:LLM class flavin-dependent oxidoreductase [Dietzia lutea]|uniref:Luciferase-like domain-containing protein n=1 Tax=Dietzia lutea TaxID=546160 RepID=A0A2S1RCY4_9ACTN|nr:LLM class flavin-dependent oxidoreductase [Dietzia lutea]AWH94122.1 hypothetical protein A6035_17390 [Dietzia lutea]